VEEVEVETVLATGEEALLLPETLAKEEDHLGGVARLELRNREGFLWISGSNRTPPGAPRGAFSADRGTATIAFFASTLSVGPPEARRTSTETLPRFHSILSTTRERRSVTSLPAFASSHSARRSYPSTIRNWSFSPGSGGPSPAVESARSLAFSSGAAW